MRHTPFNQVRNDVLDMHLSTQRVMGPLELDTHAEHEKIKVQTL